MVTTVLKNALSSVLFTQAQKKISVIDFVMELGMFNSKINDWLQHSPNDVRVSLQHDIGLSEDECLDVLLRLQNKYGITFTWRQRRYLLKTGYRIIRIFNVTQINASLEQA